MLRRKVTYWRCCAGGTALHWAAASGNKDMVAVLMERATDVNSPSYSGQTPLHVAAACGHDDIVRLLLNDNAQPDISTHPYAANLPIPCLQK